TKLRAALESVVESQLESQLESVSESQLESELVSASAWVSQLGMASLSESESAWVLASVSQSRHSDNRKRPPQCLRARSVLNDLLPAQRCRSGEDLHSGFPNLRRHPCS